jgi:glucose-6-phosphate 1-dehydrogenase
MATDTQSTSDAQADAQADALVIFGITGDLAKVMTFYSLYRLEARGLLTCPVVGVAVDDWSTGQLVQRARESVLAKAGQLDEDVFARFAARLSYVSGDFSDESTYQRVGAAVQGFRNPVYYLEIPPFLFATVIKGLSEAGLTKTSRVVVEKPFGRDLASARALAAELHQYIDESQLCRIDHYLGKMGIEEVLYLRFANSIFEPLWNRTYIKAVEITMAEAFGVQTRGHFYDPVGALRDVVVNHLMQVVAATAMEPPPGHGNDAVRLAQLTLLRTVKTAEIANYVRGQHEGYTAIPGVAPDSTTETFAALRLDIENWRWSGVPFFIRTGKLMPLTQTEVRVVFREPPQFDFGFGVDHLKRPDNVQLVVKLDPGTGIRLVLDARRAEGLRPEPITLDMEFADEGGEAPTPYEVLLHAAMIGRMARFSKQDVVEENWRILQPLVETPPPVLPYQAATWGPAAAAQLTAEYGGWHGPWVS